METNKREEFYQSLKTLSTKIQDVDFEVLKKKDRVNKSLQKIVELSKHPTDNFKSNQNEIEKQLEKTLELIRESLNFWQERQKERLNQEKFRDEFKESFLVIIYGKVKAGKSSLGNFVADQGSEYELKPEFFKYDEAGNHSVTPKMEELEEDSFYVDNCEATNIIQGFKLSGLTWIDTPGLHSMTEQNGKLAQRYIDAADYILFPTSSDAPGRATELKEILDLTYNREKRIDVVITKSDESEQDEVDGKIITILKNKTKENRKIQEEDVKKRILQEIELVVVPYSFSVHAASKGLKEKDRSLYEESQIEIFYERMTEIVKNEAVKLKAEQPIKSLRAFANHYLIGDTKNPEQHTLKYIVKNLDETIESRKKALDTLEKANAKTEAEIVQQIEFKINENYSKINKDNDIQIIHEIVDELEKDLKNRAIKNIEESMKDFDKALINLKLSININDFKIKEKTKTTKHFNKNKVENIGKGVGAAAASLGIYAAINAWNPTGWVAGAGALLASIAAASAGAMAGGKIGEQFASEEEISTVVGDTKEEMLDNLKKKFGELCRIQLDKMRDDLDNCYLKPISNFASGLKSNLLEIQESIIKDLNEKL